MLVLPVQLLPQVTSVQIELFLSKVESMKRWGLRRHDDFIWGHNLSDHRLPKGGNDANGKAGDQRGMRRAGVSRSCLRLNQPVQVSSPEAVMKAARSFPDPSGRSQTLGG